MRLSYKISEDRRTLTVTAGKSARAELAELGQDIHSDKSLYEAFDKLIANTELQWINPSECGDLTDAPILGIYGAGPDDKDPPVAERWGFMQYQVVSPLQELRDTGRAVFTAP